MSRVRRVPFLLPQSQSSRGIGILPVRQRNILCGDQGVTDHSNRQFDDFAQTSELLGCFEQDMPDAHLSSRIAARC